MERERLIDEALMLMPTWMRAIGGPDLAFVKGLRSLTGGFGVAPGEA